MLDIVIELDAEGISIVRIGGHDPSEMPYQVMIHDYRNPTFIPREDHFVNTEGERMDVYPANVIFVDKQTEPELVEDFLLRKLRKWLPSAEEGMIDVDPLEVHLHPKAMLEIIQKLEQLSEGYRETSR